MRRRLIAAHLVALAAAGASSVVAQGAGDAGLDPALRAPVFGNGPDCGSIDACIDLMRGPDAVERDLKAGWRLRAYGDAAVAVILPRLEALDPEVRRRAFNALMVFAKIEPRHAPTLMRLYPSMAGLAQPLARTGTPEALALVWERSRVRQSLEACRDTAEQSACGRASEELRAFPELGAHAIPLLDAVLRSPRTPPLARRDLLARAVEHRAPMGLEIGMARLRASASLAASHRTALPPTEEEPDHNAPDTGVWVGAYGPAAREAGPLIAPFLEARGMRRSRLGAALAVGQIGYREGLPTLLAQWRDFDDDWTLAYNAAEGLGRMGAGEAVLKTLARDHWYSAVRNNATRALNLMAGGDFVLPGVFGDGPEAVAPDGLYLRYRADMPESFASQPTVCVTAARRPWRADSPRVPWPGKAAGVVGLTLQGPETATIKPLLEKYPTLRLPHNLPPSLAVAMGRHWIVGTNAGEFGGAVHALGPDGEVRLLIPKNAITAFPIDGGLLIATGLSHGSADGDLWVVGPDRTGAPQVLRRIRLPSQPWAFRAAWPQTLVMTTAGEEVAITRAGKMTRASAVAGCGG